MMSAILRIAGDEWRYWLRSKLAVWAMVLFSALLLSATFLNGARVSEDEHARKSYQEQSEETFLSQPDRHPHRMVHYGHYAFRAPSPLAIFDPGLDAVTGQAIFLEGHRQNTASFDDASASADLGGLSWLSPARTYQLLAPLLVFLLGYGAVVRERESQTLATLLLQGIGGGTLLTGKLLALLSLCALSLIPLLVAAWIAESAAAGLSLAATYFAYLGIWAVLTIVVGASFRKRSTVLGTMTALWLVTCLLVPSIAVDAEARSTAHVSKIEADLKMLTDLRELGDGHNANDPAFAKLRDNLLAQYDVNSVEELPVNFRGVVAQYSEAELTDTLNRYASERMQNERKQSDRLLRFGWVSPALAVAGASRSIAGTDLAHYHRFLREAETLRFEFVQGLNKAHAEVLSYTNDVNRNIDAASGKKARISAENWAVLDEFVFTPDALSARISNARSTLIMLISWFVIALFVMFTSGRRLQP